MSRDVPASALKRADQNPPFADKYAVERVLGCGGMGTVFEARHLRLGHRVAIKVLGEELRVHPELVKRFEREARTAGALSSPHAVRVFDIDQTDDGTPFMVMELLRGRDLANLVEQNGAQPIGASVRWLIEASDAIAEAHRLGIVHRDIKPSNLFLCTDTNSIKVLDFGIAKRPRAKEAVITLGVTPLGTPQYMSPEQIRCAKDVDARTDIWSLGVTLYELVCGRPPFNHEIAQACIAAIVADPVPHPREFIPDLPEQLASVIMRALSKDRERRFQSVADLVVALAPFSDRSIPAEDHWWSMIATARRNVASEYTTQAPHDGSRERRLPSGMEPKVASDEETVKRVVFRKAGRASTGTHVRSLLAIASAAATLVGFASIPRCADARLDAALAAETQMSETTTKAAAVPTATPSAVSTSTPSAVFGPEVPVVSPLNPKLVPTRAADAAPRPARRSPSPVVKPSRPTRSGSRAPVRTIGGERQGHGGTAGRGS